MKKIETGKHGKVTKRKLQPPVAQIGGADYGRLLADIKERVRAAQYGALRTVNKELVALYWDIGRMEIRGRTTYMAQIHVPRFRSGERFLAVGVFVW